MIDRQTIDRILAAVPIEDLVGDYVRLTKRGSNYIGLCPFHSEKTPSFNVSPSRGIYKCFGCGKGGNAVSFLMEIEQLNFIDAIKRLAKRAGIQIEEREETEAERQQRTEHESLMLLLEWAENYYQKSLTDSTEGKVAGLGYLTERGVTAETIAKFGLGYSPADGHAMSQAALQAGYSASFLQRVGLVTERNGELYDRFRERVMFPIRSVSGRPIGFGGRALRTDGKLAKYINSPEGEIYHKSETLFGLSLAKRAIAQQDRCFLVEGYLDVIQLHQQGLENVVASSGTSLTTEQTRLIGRFTKNVVLLYDGDSAGIKAAERGADLLLAEGINVSIVLLPEGQDPDDFAKAHTLAEIQDFVESNRKDFIHFKAANRLKAGKGDPAQLAKLAQDVVKSIAFIPDGITRALYIQEAARQFSLSEELLTAEVSKQRGQKPLIARPRNPDTPSTEAPTDAAAEGEADSPEVEPKAKNPYYVQERELASMLLRYGVENIQIAEEGESGVQSVRLADYMAAEFAVDGIAFTDPLLRSLYDGYQQQLAEGAPDPQQALLSGLDPELTSLCIDLTTDRYPLSKRWFQGGKIVDLSHDDLSLNAQQVVLAFKWDILSQELASKREELKNPELTSEEVDARMHQIHDLSQVLCRLSELTRRI